MATDTLTTPSATTATTTLTTTLAAATVHPPERTKFRALLLANPNYFGNLKDSPFKPVKPMVGNTTYEELTCVGYNPDANLLKAVVWVKLDGGYGGKICTNGSVEYVRFYVSFDNGASWQDQGLASFNAYDVPGEKPLEYAVTLQPPRHSTFCFRESLPRLRGILSWNFPPPANTPDFAPVWGNVREAHIQVHPLRFFPLADILKEAKIALPKELEAVIDPNVQIEAAAPKPAGAAALLALYKEKDPNVKQHRVLFPAVQKYIAGPSALSSSAVPFADLGIDLGAIIGAIDATDGDTGFEQLQCVGLDPNSWENLVGILKIKRAYGYGGSQCQQGSQEYVAFWIDWEDGNGWQWVGTTTLNVHDFSTIPPDGLEYGVAQPINLAAHRKPCGDGPVIARVRAILSWAVAPPAGNPDYKPTWGNRVETLIHVYPGTTVKAGDYTPYLEGVCSVSTCSINQMTGLATGEHPFGGSVSIFGFIPGAPNVATAPANRPKYRCSVRPSGTITWQHLNDPFGVTVEEQTGGGIPTFTSATQSVGVDDFYTYLDAPPVAGVGWRQVFPSHLLAVWNTSGKTGLWDIMVEALDPVSNTPYVAGMITCVADGTSRQNVTIELDNAAPLTSLAITGFSRGGGPVQPAVDCATFQVGDVISGTYSVADEHFGSFTLDVQPAAHTHGATVNPHTRSYPTVPNAGESGTWTLDTKGMDPCGYTVQLLSSDRTFASCGSPWENNSAFVGFCLVAKA